MLSNVFRCPVNKKTVNTCPKDLTRGEEFLAGDLHNVKFWNARGSVVTMSADEAVPGDVEEKCLT